MAMNKIQFRAGILMTEVFDLYGSESTLKISQPVDLKRIFPPWRC